MLDRTQERFGLWPARLAADSAYGSAENLAWLVHERGIEPHIPVFDKSQRSDGTFSRSDLAYDHARDLSPARAGRSCDRARNPITSLEQCETANQRVAELCKFAEGTPEAEELHWLIADIRACDEERDDATGRR